MRQDSTAYTTRPSVPVAQEVRFWMRTPVVTVNVAASLSETLAIMRKHNIRHLPVVLDTGELCGIITQGDIRGADVLCIGGVNPHIVAAALQRIKVYDVLTERPITVTPETGVREAALLMIENKCAGLPVVEAGFVVGIVTESDLVEVLIQQLDRAESDAQEFEIGHYRSASSASSGKVLNS